MDRRRILIILLLVLGFILIIGVVAFLVFGYFCVVQLRLVL